MEVLAPAGGVKQLNAAFAAGADAVYLGMKLYSARSGSQNFSVDELKELIGEAKSRGVKIYVALNTLIKNSELEECVKLADEIYMAGADALIIQDFGLLHRLCGRYEDMQLHASTQMSIHSVDGAKFAKDMGLDRVILARELSLDEIRAISKLGIETEVFVHGAICISYSGQCSMSASKGQRSANRGSCAQPCRLNYELVENGERSIRSGHLISPKEKCLIDDIPALKEAGVSSIKIEGRLRNEFYTFETVRQYKNATENKPYSKDAIKQIFNRGEFTSLCLNQKPNRDYINEDMPSNKGIFLGEVKNGRLQPEIELQTGDGISIESGGGFIVTKISDVTPKPTAKNKYPRKTIVVFPRNYKDGDRLYKSSSQAQKNEITKKIEESIKKHEKELKAEPMKFKAKAYFEVGREFKLEIMGLKDKISLSGTVVEKPINKPITREKLLEQLSKHSDTGLSLEVIDIAYEEGFLPLSKINELRRDILKELEDTVHNDENSKAGNGNNRIIRAHKEAEKEPLTSRENIKWQALITLTKKSQLEAYLSLAKDERLALCLNPFYKDRGSLYFNDVKKLDKEDYSYYIQTPVIIRNEANDIVGKLRTLKGLKGILTGNAGLAHRLRREFVILGDEGLNIFNDEAIKLFPYIPLFIPQAELSTEDISSFKQKDRLLYSVYGKRKQMTMEYCPNQSGIPCIADCKRNDYKLGDSIVKHELYCRAVLFNSTAQSAWHLAEKDGLENRKLVLNLVDEDYAESLNLIKRLIISLG